MSMGVHGGGAKMECALICVTLVALSSDALTVLQGY